MRRALKHQKKTSKMSKKTEYTLVGGTIIHSVSQGELEILESGAILSKNGVIQQVVPLDDTPTAFTVLADGLKGEIREADGEYTWTAAWYGKKLIMPGLIDTHCHAPQYYFTGTGMDLPLLQWLEKYTFPCESKFHDVQHAKEVYKRSVKAHLHNGSTFCSYFATIHSPAALILGDVCQQLGQRAFVGKVSMDRNSPDFYIEETKQGCEDAEEFVRGLLSRTSGGKKFLQAVDETGVGGDKTLLNDTSVADMPLVIPCITPRFVPTCTEPMMKELGRIAHKYGLPIQSHLSENVEECQWVAALHPDIVGYGNVYAQMGLLNDKTFMAHCVYSDEKERRLMKEAGCGVCHCASSNFSLGSGVMDIRLFLDDAMKVGLGTDVAGGYSASMLDAIRQAITASTVSSLRRRDELVKDPSAGKPLAPLSYKEAFYLATVGGAEVLGMDKIVGNFTPGKRLDCLVVDLEAEGSQIDLFGFEDSSERFSKFLYLGDDRNISHIYVDGAMVKGN